MAIRKYKPTTNGRRGMSTLINEEIAINYSDYSDFVSVLDFEKLELDNYLKQVSDEKYENLMKECDWNNRFSQIMQVITEKGLV